MKRDMELIRKLPFAIEGSDSFVNTRGTAIDGFTKEQIAYHAVLIVEARLVVATELRGDKLHAFLVERLTWQGHEFLDAARNESVWTKAVGTMREKGIGMGFDLLKDMLVHFGRSAIGLV